MTVASPCIGVCLVGIDRTCQGCFRTLDEIGRWSTTSDRDKQFILAAVAKRVSAQTRPSPAMSKHGQEQKPAS